MQFHVTTLKFLSLVLTILVTAGCADDKNETPNPFRSRGWDVNASKVACTEPGRCPEAVGVLFSVNGEMVHRCTATLYEPTKIVTAGHCTANHKAGTKSYFRTAERPGKPSRTYPVARVLGQVFNGNDDLSTDYAAMELAVPVTGVSYAKGPVSGRGELTEFTTVVANMNAGSFSNLRLDSVNCDYDDEDSDFPHISAFPDVFPVKNCRLVKGNSGGAIFARTDLTTILGVLSRSTEASSESEDDFSRRLRELFDNNNRPRNRATYANASCFRLPGWPAPAPQCLTMGRKTAGTLSRERIRTLLNAEVIRLTEEYFKRNPAVNYGQGQVKMAPRLVNGTKNLFGTAERQQYIFVLPTPLCFIGSPTVPAAKYFSDPGRLVKVSGQRLTLEKSWETFTGDYILSRDGLGDWMVRYVWSDSAPFGIKLDDATVRTMKAGEAIKLNECSGNDEAKFMAQLRAELDRPGLSASADAQSGVEE